MKTVLSLGLLFFGLGIGFGGFGYVFCCLGFVLFLGLFLDLFFWGFVFFFRFGGRVTFNGRSAG